MGRFLKRLFKLGLLAGAGYALWRWFESQRSESDMEWEAQPLPYPPQPRGDAGSSVTAPAAPVSPMTTSPGAPAGADPAWVEPVGGTCPPGYPVKAKMSSRIFHVHGGVNYERTKPDRCYRDATAAEADGLRKSAR